MLERAFALTIPWETVCPIPNGLPIASAMSPTRTGSEVPRAMAGRFSPSTLITAKSVSPSVPTMYALVA